MRARPSVARVEAELGLLRGDSALIGRAIDELEAIGDVEHAARVAAEAGPRLNRRVAPTSG